VRPALVEGSHPPGPPQSERSDAGESFERRIARDILAVLETEAPGVDPIAVGLAIAAEARRRQGEEAGAWGDRAS
jgi:hypothetical protein